jgi:hypothetical protein
MDSGECKSSRFAYNGVSLIKFLIFSLVENVVKECAEEASVPEDLARSALPVGTLSYTNFETAPNGAKRLARDTLFRFSTIYG